MSLNDNALKANSAANFLIGGRERSQKGRGFKWMWPWILVMTLQHYEALLTSKGPQAFYLGEHHCTEFCHKLGQSAKCTRESHQVFGFIPHESAKQNFTLVNLQIIYGFYFIIVLDRYCNLSSASPQTMWSSIIILTKKNNVIKCRHKLHDNSTKTYCIVSKWD